MTCLALIRLCAKPLVLLVLVSAYLGREKYNQVCGQLLAGILGLDKALAEGGGGQVGRIAGLEIALEGEVVRPAPAVRGILPVPEGIEMFLPPRRRDVEAFAGFQIDAGGQDMDVDAAVWVVVLDGRPGGSLVQCAAGFEPVPIGPVAPLGRLLRLCLACPVWHRPTGGARRNEQL